MNPIGSVINSESNILNIIYQVKLDFHFKILKIDFIKLKYYIHKEDVEMIADLINKKIENLPEDLKSEALLFIDFLLEKKVEKKRLKSRPIGLPQNTFTMSSDFSTPLSEEELKVLGFE